MGFEIIINFKPFIFAKNPSDFWNRWHRSLTFWIRDYLFIGVRLKSWGQFKKMTHVLLVFVLIGLWHDAHWAWITFGVFHGICLFGHQKLVKLGVGQLRSKYSVIYGICGKAFMSLFLIISGLLHLVYIHGIPETFYQSLSLKSQLETLGSILTLIWFLLPVMVPLFIYEYFQEKSDNYDYIVKAKFYWQAIFVAFCFAGLFVLERSAPQGFIYFDF